MKEWEINFLLGFNNENNLPAKIDRALSNFERKGNSENIVVEKAEEN